MLIAIIPAAGIAVGAAGGIRNTTTDPTALNPALFLYNRVNPNYS